MGDDILFWFKKPKNVKPNFDTKATTKNIKQYIQDKLQVKKLELKPPVKVEVFRINSGQEEQTNPVRFSLRGLSIEDDYKAWEKGHSGSHTFSALILRKINEKEMSAKQFYNKAGLDRKLFSKLKNDYCYQPTKATAIRCCLALALSSDEADYLLKVSGYALSETIPFDLIIRYCINHGITNIENVNQVLYDLEEKIL